MSVSGGEKRRAVVPRWRSLTNTPSVETVPAVRFPEVEGGTELQFKDLLKEWRVGGKPEDYVDILDAGIAVGSRKLALEGATFILKNTNQFQPLVVHRASVVAHGKSGYVAAAIVENSSIEETHKKIARLKTNLVNSPRNSLAHVEIARLYSRLAQTDPAARHIALATALAPNDRFVLRAMTRFYTMIGVPEDALQTLWRAKSLQFDPWLQSAELAAAMLARKSTKAAHKVADRMLQQRQITRDQSELASGWATKMDRGGASEKKVLRLLASTLSEPTENALAQSVWLTDQVGKDFSKTFPNVHLPDDAHEARSLAWVEEGRFAEAAAEAAIWAGDQPFQARSFVLLAFINTVHLNDHETALAAVQSGLTLHSDDWALLNLGVIAAAFAGKREVAETMLARLEKSAESDYAKAFLLAATGLLHFSRGRHPEGVEKYLETIRYCRSKGLNDLSINAAIFLLENLCIHGLISKLEAEEFKSAIEKQANRLPFSDRRDAFQMLRSRERVWSIALDENGDGVDLLRVIRAEEFEALLREDPRGKETLG